MMREGGVNGLVQASVGEEELDELREDYKASLEKTKLELEEEKHRSQQRKLVKRKAESTNVSYSGGKKKRKD